MHVSCRCTALVARPLPSTPLAMGVGRCCGAALAQLTSARTCARRSLHLAHPLGLTRRDRVDQGGAAPRTHPKAGARVTAPASEGRQIVTLIKACGFEPHGFFFCIRRRSKKGVRYVTYTGPRMVVDLIKCEGRHQIVVLNKCLTLG